MDLTIIKEWAPVFSAIVAPSLIALVKLAWDIKSQLTEMKALLQDQGESLKLQNDRIEVHDQLAASLFGKPVSSKLISEGRQDWPSLRKPIREQ